LTLQKLQKTAENLTPSKKNAEKSPTPFGVGVIPFVGWLAYTAV
jgi:hypothetical protein